MNSMRKTERCKGVPLEIAIGAAILVLVVTSPRLCGARAMSGPQTPAETESFLDQEPTTQAQHDA